MVLLARQSRMILQSPNRRKILAEILSARSNKRRSLYNVSATVCCSPRVINSRSICIVPLLPILGVTPVYIFGQSYQDAYKFSTQVDVDAPYLPLLVNKADKLPDIYASPAELLKVHFKGSSVAHKSIIISKDGKDEQWHTATMSTNFCHVRSEFHSGKFGPFIKTIDKNNAWDEAETLIVDGKVHYRCKNVALEAAAARALDSIAFGKKYMRKAPTNTLPIRYCVELPQLFSSGKEQNNTHAPKYYWELLMTEKYGPMIHDIQYDVLSMPFSKNESISEGEEPWYSATCHEPTTGETFNSGVFGLGMQGNSYLPDAPLTPLPLEEIRIHNDRVYYRDELTAKHAAAARAIDCLNFRTNNEKEYDQLCLEEPYLFKDASPKMQQADYDVLKSIVDQRRRGEPEFSFAERILMRKCRDSPDNVLLQILHVKYGNLYVQRGRMGSYGKLYDMSCLEKDDGIWCTATFIDPVTKEQFSSGVVRALEDGQLGTDLAEIQIFNEKVYYKDSVKYAIKAAAARALDCYCLRDNTQDEKEIPTRFCFEEPYNIAEEGEFQIYDYDTVLKQREDDLAIMKEHSIYEEKMRENTNSLPTRGSDAPISSSVKKYSQLLHAPKSLLHNLLVKIYSSKQIGSITYDVQKMIQNGKLWYTATVTDPMTNEVFSSGFIKKEVKAEKRPTSYLNPPLHRVESKIIDGKVYYTESKYAEHAAAARCIDCYLFRENHANNIQQLCVEEPYYEKSTETNLEQTETTHKWDETLRIASSGDTVNEGGSGENNISPVAKEPSKNNKVGSHTLSTMGRIAEIWTTTSNIDDASRNDHKPGQSMNIESVLKWYKRINTDPHNRGEALSTIQLLKKILTALGSATQQSEEEGFNVEENARRIRDEIISISKAFDEAVHADIFNAYIKCLNQLDPKHSAEAAENLLKRMNNRETIKDTILPSPTIETYNNVMRLCALVDEAHVNNIYSLLESASLISHDGQSLHPNKDTFKILLAANSKLNGCFSFEQAQRWLSKVEQVSSNLCGEELIPDADLYNSALGSLSSAKKSSNSKYANSWLRFGDQYEGGFKENVNKFSNDEASNIADWLLFAEEHGINPNVDMYEQVIKACTKLGTKEGLLMAEDWARRAALSNSYNSSIRLETFHPVIAAWALCQLDRAPGRVKEWVSQLSAFGETRPGLKPDLSTLSAQIIAWKNVQTGIIARVDGAQNIGVSTESCPDQEDIGMVYTCAQNCTQHLDEIINSNTLDELLNDQEDTDAMISMLTHTIDAWGCALRLALANPTSSVSRDSSQSVLEMLKMARYFDAKLLDEEQQDEEYAQKILEIMGNTYAEIISQLYQIDSAASVDSKDKASYFSLGAVEKMLNDYDNFAKQYVSRGNSTEATLRHRLYNEVLQGCSSTMTSTNIDDDVLRLCRVMMDELTWQNEQRVDIGREKQDISDIYVAIADITGKVVKDTQERTEELTLIWNHAMPFFFRRFNASNYGVVDRARLIGGLRMAMGDADNTEDFIQSFEQWKPKRKGRVNAWTALVDNLVRKPSSPHPKARPRPHPLSRSRPHHQKKKRRLSLRRRQGTGSPGSNDIIAHEAGERRWEESDSSSSTTELPAAYLTTTTSSWGNSTEQAILDENTTSLSNSSFTSIAEENSNNKESSISAAAAPKEEEKTSVPVKGWGWVEQLENFFTSK